MRSSAKVWVGIFTACALALAAGAALGQEKTARDAWRTHKDPTGFQVTLPAKWHAAGDADTGRIELRGEAGDAIEVWPVFVPGALDASPQFNAQVFLRLAHQCCPPGEWSPLRQVGAAALQMSGRRKGATLIAAYAWVGTQRGTAGYLYCVTVPKGMTSAAEGTYSRVLASLRLSGRTAAAQPAEPAVRYVSWVDPVEQAFSIEVPAGWTVRGGTRRVSAADVRNGVELVSPDQTIVGRGGDLDVPMFIEPVIVPSMGVHYPEGSWYPTGYGQCFVQRYLPGAMFARWLAQQRTSGLCQGFAVTGQRDRADAVRIYLQYMGALGQSGVQMATHAGEVELGCERDGRPLQGYAYAQTFYHASAGGPAALWNVGDMLIYVSTPEQVGVAAAVTRHLGVSFKPNPQWLAMQRKTRQASIEIEMRTRREISNIIAGVHARRSASEDRIAGQRTLAIRGLENVVDPATGRALQVESGSDYYWVDPSGMIVGTQSRSQPGVDFRELMRVR